MPKYEVIKAHDGLPVGTIKDVPADSISAYMVDNGYWREIAEPIVNKQKKSGAAQVTMPKTEPKAASASTATKKNRSSKRHRK